MRILQFRYAGQQQVLCSKILGKLDVWDLSISETLRPQWRPRCARHATIKAFKSLKMIHVPMSRYLYRSPKTRAKPEVCGIYMFAKSQGIEL